MGGACSTHGVAVRNTYKILVGKLEGRRPLERPVRRWEDNIIMDLREIWWEGVDCIHVAQDRDQWRVLRFSRRTLLHVVRYCTTDWRTVEVIFTLINTVSGVSSL